MKLLFAKRVVKDLSRLDSSLQKRIIDKLEFYTNQKDPLKFAEKLVNNPYGTHRFRIGDYRVICDVVDDTIQITVIGHRREIYR